jgi:hypothetical protein
MGKAFWLCNNKKGEKMTIKKVLNQDRKRIPPKIYSWVDHRLVRDKYIGQCSPDASALYLFLITVGDVTGLSYYSDRSIGGLISLDLQRLKVARENLLKVDLIAYEKPLYQVLMLPNQPINRGSTNKENIKPKLVRNPSGQFVPIGELLRTALGKNNKAEK